MKMGFIGAAAAAALAWTAGPAAACSLMPETVLPTNYELVQLADAVVVATPLSSTPMTDGDMGSARFRVDSVLKGDAPAEVTASMGRLGHSPRSDPDELLSAHPESMQGGCTRHTFVAGQKYVLFVGKMDDGRYGVMFTAFSRVAEDYAGEGSLWVRTIRAYAAIQREAPAEQRRRLEAMLSDLLAKPKSKVRDQQATDIVMELASLSPYAPTDHLLSIYAGLERGEAGPFLATTPRTPLEQAFVRAVPSAAGPDHPNEYDRLPTLEEQKTRVLQSLVNGEHPGATPLFDRLASDETASPRLFGLSIRFLTDHGQLGRAYDLIEHRGVRLLLTAPQDQANGLLNDIRNAMNGPYSEDGPPRWRGDPRVTRAWPELALGLSRLSDRFQGEGGLFADAIGDLRPADYRTRPEVTLALAAGSDGAVLAWAMAQLNDAEARRVWEARTDSKGPTDDAMDLPMQVLVLGFGEVRDAEMNAVFCQSHDRRYQLMMALGEVGDAVDSDWLLRMSMYPKLTDDERDGLVRALSRNMGRGEWFNPWYENIGKVMRREPVETTFGPALTCPAGSP